MGADERDVKRATEPRQFKLVGGPEDFRVRSRVDLSDGQLDRVEGVLLGAACGDALGVPYEFVRGLPDDFVPEMVGGGLGPYEPGEYSDDTQMQVCVAKVAAAGGGLRSDSALDEIAGWFLRWFREGASDVGNQTRHVLQGTAGRNGLSAVMREMARELHERTGRSAGNGSLMRTGIVALPYLCDEVAMAEAARAVSALTHFDELAADACVLWCSGIRHAVMSGNLGGVRAGLELLPIERRDRWRGWLDEAEEHTPDRFAPNGFVVAALQAAWSAISHADGLENGLIAAVRAGDDTDTVAAIAGALLGARHGASAIPARWRERIHGWPGLRVDDLVELAARSGTTASRR